MKNIYFFTVIASHYSKDNIDVQIYASNFWIAREILIMLYPMIRIEDLKYDYRASTASPLQWIGTA